MDKKLSTEDINKLRKLKTLNGLYGMYVPNIVKPLSMHEKVFIDGYIKGIKDLIKRMDNDIENYVDPYEIPGIIHCLENVAKDLISEIKL